MQAPLRISKYRIVVELAVSLIGIGLLVWAFHADREWWEAHSFWRYCTGEPKELRRAAMFRWGAALVAALLILGVRPRLGRWAARRSPPSLKSALGSALPILLAIVLALAVCDRVLRLPRFRKRPDSVPFVTVLAHNEFQNNRSSSSVIDYAGHIVTYTIDDAGDRVRTLGETIDVNRPTLLFGGESVAFGFGVTYDESYPTKVGAALGVQVANSAVSAFANDQVYMRTREELARFTKPLAVVILVVPPQLTRNVDPLRQHHVPRADGTIEEIAPLPEIYVTSPLRELMDNVFPYHDSDAFRIARATFSATAREARGRGAYPLFVMTNWGSPCYPRADGTIALEDQFFEGLDVPHIRVDLDVALWDLSSIHPDARAHDRLADAITRALRGVISIPKNGSIEQP